MDKGNKEIQNNSSEKLVAERELEGQLKRDLQLEEHKNKLAEIREQHENKYIEPIINFFTTLGVLYLILFGVKFLFLAGFFSALLLLEIQLTWLNPLLHGTIWFAAVVSAFRRRSILDDIVNMNL